MKKAGALEVKLERASLRNGALGRNIVADNSRHYFVASIDLLDFNGVFFTISRKIPFVVCCLIKMCMGSYRKVFFGFCVLALHHYAPIRRKNQCPEDRARGDGHGRHLQWQQHGRGRCFKIRKSGGQGLALVGIQFASVRFESLESMEVGSSG